MMKKLMIIVLVLSLASVSMAAFAPSMGILVNGQTWDGGSVKPSDIITVQWIDLETTTPGSLGMGFNQQVSDGELQGNVFLLPGGLFAKNQTSMTDTGFKVMVESTYFIGTPMPQDRVIFSFSFHVPELPASTYIDIDTTGVYGGALVDNLDARIHVTPEPMTVMLLGLGGLFLRRRKA
jgi:hypothetical protein